MPELRGSAKSSFEYTLAIKNDSGKKLLVSLSAQAPKNFDASFTEEYGSQELTALPIDAGQSKNVKLKVRPPSTVASGSYPVSVKVAAEDASANAKVTLQVTGQPKLDIAGREGLVSARASAGQEDLGSGDGVQHGFCARDRCPACRLCAERMEGRVQPEGDPVDRAE